MMLHDMLPALMKRPIAAREPQSCLEYDDKLLSRRRGEFAPNCLTDNPCAATRYCNPSVD
jgi:hypothetical protein